MARTSSLNCLSCRNPYQTPHSLNPSPLFTENPFFFTESASSDPLPKNRLLSQVSGMCRAIVFLLGGNFTHPPFHAFFPKKAWVSPKKRSFSACLPFSALFFFSQKRLRSRVFEFSTHAFFVNPPIAFVTTKKGWVELTPKKHRNERSTETGIRVRSPKKIFTPVGARNRYHLSFWRFFFPVL